MSALWNKIFGERVLDVHTSGGAFNKYYSERVNKYDVKDVASYFQAYLDYDLIRGPVDDLSESAFGKGYYTTVDLPDLEPGATLDKRNPLYKAKTIVDDFGREFNIDELLANCGKLALIAGFCGAETIFQRNTVEDPWGKSSIKIIHPETIKKDGGIETNELTGQVIKVIQKVGTKEENPIEHEGWKDKNTWHGIAWFTYGKLGNDPRGVSFVRGMINLLNTINKVTNDVDKILERYIGPLGLWTSEHSIEAIQKSVTGRDQGQDIFIGNIKPDERKGLVEFLQIDPHVPYWDYIEYMDRRIYAYSRANNTWYSRNATEASAKVIDDIVSRHLVAIERGFKRTIERDWFQPLMDLNSLDVLPKVNFGAEPTGVEDIQVEMIVTKMLEMGYIDEPQSLDLLRQLGLKLKVTAERELGEDEPEEEPEDTPDEEPEDEPDEVEEEKLRYYKLKNQLLEKMQEMI